MSEIEQYVKEQIEKGYTNSEGAPLKCPHCESTDFDEKAWFEWHVVCEKEVTCKSCGNIIGSWQYGRWEVI